MINATKIAIKFALEIIVGAVILLFVIPLTAIVSFLMAILKMFGLVDRPPPPSNKN